MTGYATAEGTRHYVTRFAANAAAAHFREPVGCGTPDESAPSLSSIGIGTYLGLPDAATDRAYTEAVIAAVEGGINVLDSAINYRLQRSERAVGAALAELARRGFERREIILCTKGGYLTADGAMSDDLDAYFESEYLRPGILQAEDIAAECHAMSPSFLRNQLDRSLVNLGVDCVDVYYLHNPETQLSSVSQEEFVRRLRLAFEFLESAVVAGKLRFYGLATWNGFRHLVQAPDFLSLCDIEKLAQDVAGTKHHFRFVQMPFSLAMTEALTLPNQTLHGPAVAMIEAAEALGISLIGSASLNQGKLANGLPGFIKEALGLHTDAERSVQFVRSSPGITAALVGMSNVDHVRANLRLVGEPMATAEQFASLFARKA